LDEKADDAAVHAFGAAARQADIVIAEVGAWSNPLAYDDAEARNAIALCQQRLNLAERIGARCCVNIAGSRGGVWCGPSTKNLTPDTFSRIVETVREIIDAVKPRRTSYTLEAMPWAYPHDTDSYAALVDAVDRDAFAVHFDPVNLINSIEKFYAPEKVIRDFIARLGLRIKSCHAKDIHIDENQFAMQLHECRPGAGVLDYRVFLSEMNRIDPEMPLMLEHLKDEAEYQAAGGHIRAVAGELGLSI